MLERLSGLETVDLAQDIGGERARIGVRRTMRRDGHALVGPHWTRRRQGLGRKDVEGRGRERSFIEGGENIGVDLQRAAPGIDQVRTAGGPVALELAQEIEPQDAVRGRRRGEQTDQYLSTAEKSIETVAAVEGLDLRQRRYTGKGFGRPAPAGGTKAEPGERLR